MRLFDFYTNHNIRHFLALNNTFTLAYKLFYLDCGTDLDGGIYHYMNYSIYIYIYIYIVTDSGYKAI